MPYLVLGLATGTGFPTELLIQSDTTNGSTTFTDSSTNNLTVNTHAPVTHSTNQAKFGATSLYFQQGSLYAANPAINVGAGDFTADFWVYPTANFSDTALFSTVKLGGFIGIDARTVSGTSQVTFKMGNTIDVNDETYDTVTLTLNTWTHLAFVRSAGQAALAVNGTFGSWAASTKVTSNPAGEISVGGLYASYNGSELDNTYIDEFRFSSTAIWTSNFTPPTAPYI